MKIEQKPKFQPITITLETQKEVLAFWDVIIGNKRDTKAKTLAIEISDWLSANAQLGGEE